MDLTKKLLTLLAIFCIIASAGVVCAADYDGYAGSSYQNMNGVSGSQYYLNEAATTGSTQDNLEPGNGLPLENQTGNVSVNAAGEPVNTTGNVTNTTGNATGNVTNTTNATGNTIANATHTAHTMPTTGNPILALLAVTGIIGGYAALRRK